MTVSGAKEGYAVAAALSAMTAAALAAGAFFMPLLGLGASAAAVAAAASGAQSLDPLELDPDFQSRVEV